MPPAGNAAHDPNAGPSRGGSPLYSPLASDPGMADLVESFVAVLPGRAAALLDAFDTGDLEELGSIVHSLKGAAGSYGFLPITEACRAVEGRLAEGSGPAAIRGSVDEVVDLCRRATARPAP